MEMEEVNIGRVPIVCPVGKESILELGEPQVLRDLALQQRQRENTAMELPNGNSVYHEVIHEMFFENLLCPDHCTRVQKIFKRQLLP